MDDRTAQVITQGFLGDQIDPIETDILDSISRVSAMLDEIEKIGLSGSDKAAGQFRMLIDQKLELRQKLVDHRALMAAKKQAAEKSIYDNDQEAFDYASRLIDSAVSAGVYPDPDAPPDGAQRNLSAKESEALEEVLAESLHDGVGG